jgi:ATP-dependent RNA helicase DHX33
VQQNDTVVVLGETGSGKTTQIPQFLFDAGFARARTASNGKRSRQMIGITQPRRVAAISLAKRVAVELGVADPDSIEKSEHRAAKLVGYSVRFDDRTSQETRIKFMTDGWLLRELLAGSAYVRGKGKRRELSDGVRDANQDIEEIESPTTTYSMLDQYAVIIIDEAHERSVHTDVVLGLVKRVQAERKRRREEWLKSRQANNGLGADEPTELKVVVMSATIDAEAFANFFADEKSRKPAPILYVKGRQFPLQLYHSAEICMDWFESCKKLVVQISSMDPGDVLIFMTGAEEIETLAAELQELNRGLLTHAEGLGKGKPMELLVTKLYAALGGEAIRKCFTPTPPGCRKVVLATNIAETSITIAGIKYVIDCGLAKERSFQSSMADEQGNGAMSGASMEMLSVKPISKAAARQRAGRAGRESGGRCFRLFTESAFETLPDSTIPEILRTDLSSVVLDVFAMGLNPLTFDWLDRPDEEGLRAAVLNLTELGALELNKAAKSQQSGHDGVQNDFRLTTLGREMSKLPLLPSLSKTLLTARDMSEEEGQDERKVFVHALDIVSILSTERRTVLIEPSTRADEANKNKASTSKRDEADRARERLAHPSGDHATQLQALYAFDQAERDCKASAKNGVRNVKDGSARLKEWCSANYVSLKAVREVKRIRQQLVQICRRQGWLVSERLDYHGNGTAVEDDDDDDDDDDEQLSTTDDESMMTVIRGPGTSFIDGNSDGVASKEDFAAVRRCLIQGKRLNTAFRQGQTASYQRAHGGDVRFRIHPSSTLLLTAKSEASGGLRLPSVIYFEDMVFTSQMFVRNVSAAEPAWLTDMTNEIRTRKNRQRS